MLKMTQLTAFAAVLSVAIAMGFGPQSAQAQTPPPAPAAAPAASTESAPAASTEAAPAPATKPAAAKETVPIDNPYGFQALLRGSDLVAKITLAILAIMSMGSWYIIITKVYEQAKMGAQARSEVIQSRAAFSGRDVELAEDLVRQDREINRLNRDIFRMAIEIGEDPDTREWAMHMILVARALERIGDNAVDIGEQVAFVVTGLFREFSDSSHPAGTRPDAAPDGGPERL